MKLRNVMNYFVNEVFTPTGGKTEIEVKDYSVEYEIDIKKTKDALLNYSAMRYVIALEKEISPYNNGAPRRNGAKRIKRVPLVSIEKDSDDDSDNDSGGRGFTPSYYPKGPGSRTIPNSAKGGGSGFGGKKPLFRAKYKDLKDNSLLDEALELTKEESSLVKGVAKAFVESELRTEQARNNIAIYKEQFLKDLRTIKSYKDLKESRFWNEKVGEMFSEIDQEIDKLLERFKNSLRGGLNSKLGSRIENVIHKALISGDYSGVEGLKSLEIILKVLDDKTRSTLTVRKPRSKIMAYDIEIKVSRSAFIIFGIHVKLLVDGTKVTPMKNIEPTFSVAAMENISRACDDCNNILSKVGIKSEDFKKKERKNSKGEKVVNFRVRDMFNAIYNSKIKYPITNRKLVYFLTLISRVNSNEVVWVVVHPDGVRTTFSEKTARIDRNFEEKKILFLNKNNEVVFKLDIETGDTIPVIRKV